jgi:DNA-binding NarL/FixJ family response regulator
MKVLIADGSPEVADCLVTMIQEIPCVEFLAPARDAMTALASIRAHQPEVVILDARIPGAKGSALLQTIRQERPGAVLIILSNLAYGDYCRRFDGAGARLFVDESVETAHLCLLGNLDRQDDSIWVKFSTGEFHMLDASLDPSLDLLATALAG